MKRSILANREDVRNVESELQYEFILHLLENMGVPPEVLLECFPEEGYEAFDAKHKVKLRKHMKNYDVEIIDDRDGGLKVYVDDDLVAEWYKPKFVLRKDEKARIKSQKLYSEIFIEYWSIFDDEEDDE